MKQLTIVELRNILTNQIVEIESGKGDLEIADSIANISGKVLKSVALEISYAEHIKGGGRVIEMMEPAK